MISCLNRFRHRLPLLRIIARLRCGPAKRIWIFYFFTCDALSVMIKKRMSVWQINDGARGMSLSKKMCPEPEHEAEEYRRRGVFPSAFGAVVQP